MADKNVSLSIPLSDITFAPEAFSPEAGASTPSPTTGVPLDSIDFSQLSDDQLASPEGRTAAQNAASPLLSMRPQGGGSPLMTPELEDKMLGAADMVIPSFSSAVKGEALPLAYMAGSIPTQMLTKSPWAARAVGGATALAADVMINQVGPNINNFMRKNLWNPFGAASETPQGPVTLGKVGESVVDTALNLAPLAIMKGGRESGRRLIEKSSERVRKVVGKYSREIDSAISIDKRMVSSIDESYAAVADMGVFNTLGDDAIRGGDNSFLANVQLKINGGEIGSGSEVRYIPGLKQQYYEKLKGLLDSSGKAISPSQVLQTLEDIDAQLTHHIRENIRRSGGGVVNAIDDAAYAGKKQIDDAIRYIKSPAGQSDQLLQKEPLIFLQSLKSGMMDLVDYRPDLPDAPVRKTTNAVMMKGAGLIKEGIERLTDDVFAGTPNAGAIKATNKTLSHLIEVGDHVARAGTALVRGGEVSSGLSATKAIATGGALTGFGAAPAMMAGDMALATKISATGAVATGLAWGVGKFWGNATNQVQAAQWQRRSGQVLQALGRAFDANGEVIVFPRNLKEMVAAGGALKRQLLGSGVSAETANLLDETLALGTDESMARGLTKILMDTDAGSVLDASFQVNKRRAKSLFYVEGVPRLFDNFEKLEYSNWLRDSTTRENELDRTKELTALHKDGTVNPAHFEYDGDRVEELSKMTEPKTEASTRSPLRAVAGNIKQEKVRTPNY